MITYRLNWEMRDGSDGEEFYSDDYEALEEMRDMIIDPEVIYASVIREETYGGMVWDVSTIEEFVR